MSRSYWQGFVDGQRNMAVKLGQYSKSMKPITRQEANKILAECSHGQMQKAVICYKGRWYDCRGMDDDKINDFVISLLGQDVVNKGIANNIKI